VLRAADAPFAKDEPTERRFEVPPEAVDIARRGVLVKISVGDRTISPVKYGSLVVPGCSMEFLVPPNVDTTEDFDREVEKRYRLLRSAQQKIFERELEDYISQVKKAHKAAVAALD
jgi:hypothetical protein